MVAGVLFAAAALACNVCDYEGGSDGFYTVAPAECACAKINRTCARGTYGVVVPNGTATRPIATSYYVQGSALSGELRRTIFNAPEGFFHVRTTAFDPTTRVVTAQGHSAACPDAVGEGPPLAAGTGFTRVGDAAFSGTVPVGAALIVGSVVLGGAVVLCGSRWVMGARR